MHKSWGNAIWFDDAAEEMGADVMRWMYAAQTPAQNLNFGYGPADEVKRRLLTLWNTYGFFVTYASLDGFEPARDGDRARRPSAPSSTAGCSPARTSSCASAAQRWTLRLAAAARAVEAFVDDLSNWYVRLSRARFWKSETTSTSAPPTRRSGTCWCTLTRCVAPVMPFLADEMWQNLVKSEAAIQTPPRACTTTTTRRWTNRWWTATAQRRSPDAAPREPGPPARNKAGVKVRQPLARDGRCVRPTRPHEEIGAAHGIASARGAERQEVVITPQVGDLITYMVKPNFAVMGPKYGKRLGAIREALAGLDPVEVAAQVKAGEPVSVTLPGEDEPVELQPGELVVETREREGFAVAQEGGLVVRSTPSLTTSCCRRAWPATWCASSTTCASRPTSR